MQETIKVHVVDRNRKFLYLRYIDPHTNKPVEKSSKATNKKEATKEAGKLETELRNGKYKPPSQTTWNEFRERYEDEAVVEMKDTTDLKVTTVFDAVERIIRPGKLSTITTERIRTFKAALREETFEERKGDKVITRVVKRSDATIRGYLATLKAALHWAHGADMLVEVPKIEMPVRSKRSTRAKGRPITGEEFDRMIAKVPEERPAEETAHWERFLRGLWWSGLRIDEALNLTWDRDDRLRVILAGEDSLLHIPAECQKKNEDSICPVAPEFVTFLEETPIDDRQGYVFKLPFRRKDTVSKVLCGVGKAAGVKVSTDGRTGKVKYASAHDLRRSFGERWKHRVMPPVLQQLMRHSDIETTMQYYTDRDARSVGKLLWQSIPTVGATPSPVPEAV